MKLLDLIESVFERREKPIGLIYGYIFLVTSVFVTLKILFPDVKAPINWIIYISLLTTWTIAWIFMRNTYPKNKKGKVGIIISIVTETDKQKIRLKDDFLKRLKDKASNNGFDYMIEFIPISPIKTERVNRVLSNFSYVLKNKNISNDTTVKSTAEFNNLNKKIKGHFFIWGNIKERQDNENKYILDLDGLVLHSPLNDPIQAKLAQEFTTVWARSINFLEKFELRGFSISADLIFIAVEYITGLAALFSGDVALAEGLHSKLETEIKNIRNKPPHIQYIEKSLSTLIPYEYNLLSIISLNRGNSKLSEEYVQRSFRRIPDNYSGLITMSLIQFKIKNDPKQALISVRKAKKAAGIDGTWRYNEAFLLMYLERFEEALALFKDIERIDFPGEDRVLSEVLDFNKSMITSSPKFYQSYFILGFLYLKKKGNYPEAFNYFDPLIGICKDQKFDIIIKTSGIYLDEIKSIMKLK
jgi:tetratricopeptide (TPR) repeat protein